MHRGCRSTLTKHLDIVKPYGGVSLSPANEAVLLWMHLLSEP